MPAIRRTIGRRHRDYYLGAGLAFGLGVAIVGGAWNNWADWNGGDINVDINRDNFNNINRDNIANRRDNANSQRWQHNTDHRRGTNYRDQATRDRFGKGNATQPMRGVTSAASIKARVSAYRWGSVGG
jgi:hypothetical protein